jgi:arginyl-tRNA synthetase
MQEMIEQAVREALAAVGASAAQFVVDRPAEAFGDFSTNAALAAAKILKKNPIEVAQVLKEKILSKRSSDLLEDSARPFSQELFFSNISKIEVAGAGFINFFLSHDAIDAEIQTAAADAEWGKNNLYAGKKIMVEYTDPNPFKEFHIGHLMSNAIGESIARVLEASGAQVVRANYQGDVGPHVAKGIFGLLQMGVESPTIADLGKAYVLGAAQYEADAAAKEKINEINKKIYEKSDEKINELYAKGRELSLQHFEDIYKVLGTTFDFYFFESETAPLGLAIVRAHPDIFVESDGAIVFHGEEYGLHTRVFINSQGLPTYEAKELGLLEAKKQKAEVDLSLTVTANETSEYFKVVRKAAELISPEMAGRMQTRFHGFLKLTTGKMSSRLGNVITGESLLADLAKAARGREDVAVGAIKYAVLKQGSGKDIIFDPEKSLSLDGDSGPYLQYAHMRALSLLKKAAGAEPKLLEQSLGAAEDFVKEVSALERLLIHYPDVVARAAKEMEPHYVTTYLTELAAAFNSWYANTRVIGGDNQEHGVLITQAVEQTLAKGLALLGIPAPEEM